MILYGTRYGEIRSRIHHPAYVPGTGYRYRTIHTCICSNMNFAPYNRAQELQYRYLPTYRLKGLIIAKYLSQEKITNLFPNRSV